MIPLWFVYALAASVCAALGMYMHQRLGGSHFASAVWLKIIALAIAIPVLMTVGLPANPLFYGMTAAAAVLWCINDLIYFRAVGTHGAALIARLSPLGLILAFVAWFVLHPDLLHRYLEDMPRFLGICATLLVTVGCALFLRRCAFSWNALQSIWFVIFASVAGSLLIKSAVDYAPENQGVFGYLGFEAGLMLAVYAAWFGLRQPQALREIFSLKGVKTGGIVGVCLVGAVIFRTLAYNNVDHPAFVTMISMLDAVWLIPMTRLSGWKDGGNKIAGLGVVAAAIALAFLKIR